MTAAIYVTYEETLPAGSKLLFYTDGFTEARSPQRDEFFEYGSMLDVFQTNRKAPCDSFINKLYEELVTFREGDSFEDDICLICLDVV